MRTLPCEELPIDGNGGLFAVLATMTDPRKRRGKRHPLQSVLAVAVCATLAGAKSFGAIYEWAADQSTELRKRLRCWHGRAPSELTLRRVLPAVDAQPIDTKIGQWLAGLHHLQGHALALDGKTLRGSRDGEDGRAVHLLAAVVHGSGEVVAQTRVDVKTNEITRVAPLLAELDIRGAVVTADALLSVTAAMAQAIEETQRRRVLQLAYNQEHGVTPKTVHKTIRDLSPTSGNRDYYTIAAVDPAPTGAGAPDRALDPLELMESLRQQMLRAAESLDFETAARLRDQLTTLREKHGATSTLASSATHASGITGTSFPPSSTV